MKYYMTWNFRNEGLAAESVLDLFLEAHSDDPYMQPISSNTEPEYPKIRDLDGTSVWVKVPCDWTYVEDLDRKVIHMTPLLACLHERGKFNVIKRWSDNGITKVVLEYKNDKRNRVILSYIYLDYWKNFRITSSSIID